ncbi:MAG TPA: nucleotide exchange factor GrpE [Anaerolineaceae bacterium]|nr:nucleotide exchange factor GrpE [Anaerolineaceae bacterium]
MTEEEKNFNESAAQPDVEGGQPAEGEQVFVNEIEDLRSELELAKSQGKEYFEGWQRERADFMNYKRRIERDQAQMAQSVTGSIAKKYLPVLDDLERALASIPEDPEAEKWAEGIELIARKLQGILESEGVQRIPAEDEQFDPNRHEAISLEDNADHASGEIIEVVQQGYMIGDRVLRPAKVRVAR